MGGMTGILDNPIASKALTVRLLSVAYANACEHRTGEASCLPRGAPAEQKLLGEVAEKLGAPELATLFVDAQFDAFNSEWCTSSFGRPIPPFRLVFGGSGRWKRYDKFLEGGIGVPISSNVCDR